MWLKNKLSFLRGAGSKPSTVLITPPWKGGTNWNMCDGWIGNLGELTGSLGVFHVGNEPREVKRLFSALSKNVPELIVLSCGDHHLHSLHDTEEKRGFWRSLKARTVCFCNERVVNSPFPMSEEKTRSAVNTFDGFVYVDEFAEKIYTETGKPAMWTTQFSDERLFHPRVPQESRHNRIYFRATLSNFGIEGVYSERMRLIERVRREPFFDVNDKLLSAKDYAGELAAQRFVLRAAANCPGYVENFWNALASGCVVFHQKLPANEVKSAGILTPGRDFLEYDASNPEELITRAAEALKNWRDYQGIAEAGRQTFLAKHTLRMFLARLLDFADRRLPRKQ